MFRRWAENRMYRRTMQLAIGELRRAARARDLLEKLQALDVAEQKLRDAQWLSPDRDKHRFETGLTQIDQSRTQALKQAVLAVNRLLDSVEQDSAERAEMLRAAGLLLSFLNHYLPADPEVEAASGRLIELGGEQPAYTPVPALSDMYHRPDQGAGCGAVIGLMALLIAGCLIAPCFVR
jgi:hypothetical protein